MHYIITLSSVFPQALKGDGSDSQSFLKLQSSDMDGEEDDSQEEPQPTWSAEDKAKLSEIVKVEKVAKVSNFYGFL